VAQEKFRPERSPDKTLDIAAKRHRPLTLPEVPKGVKIALGAKGKGQDTFPKSLKGGLRSESTTADSLANQGDEPMTWGEKPKDLRRL
jgi:hypothetical protein